MKSLRRQKVMITVLFRTAITWGTACAQYAFRHFFSLRKKTRGRGRVVVQIFDPIRVFFLRCFCLTIGDLSSRGKSAC